MNQLPEGPKNHKRYHFRTLFVPKAVREAKVALAAMQQFGQLPEEAITHKFRFVRDDSFILEVFKETEGLIEGLAKLQGVVGYEELRGKRYKL